LRRLEKEGNHTPGNSHFEKKAKAGKMTDEEEKQYEEFQKNYMNENLKSEGTKNFRALHNSDLPDGLVYFLQHNSNTYELNVLVLEVLNLSVMFRKLVKKFCSIGLLKDIVIL
jgi:hypothetical protein